VERETITDIPIEFDLSEMDPEEFFNNNFELINAITVKVCRKYSFQPADLEDVQSYVCERLVRNDFRIIREEFSQHVSRSYLTVIIRNFVIDCMRSTQGQWRPSEKAKVLGKIAIEMEELLNRQQLSFGEACETILTRCSNRDEIPPTFEELGDIRDKLKIKTRTKTVTPGDDFLETTEPTDPTAEEEYHLNELNILKENIDRIIEEIKEGFSAEDRLVFKLYFESNKTISSIARSLDRKRHQIERLIKRNLQDAKSKLLNAGITIDQIQDILPHINELQSIN